MNCIITKFNYTKHKNAAKCSNLSVVNTVCKFIVAVLTLQIQPFPTIQDGVVFENPEKEDPTVYVSEKTGRGPLDEEWIRDYWSEIKGSSKQPTPSGKAIMCAYKLCKVEFRYWGMQSKIER